MISFAFQNNSKVSLEKLKLSKPLITAMTSAGLLSAKEIQLKTMSRMQGGQDVVAIAPDGSGKTTAYVLATLMRIKYGFEEAPRALILVPTKDKLEEVLAQFELLNKNETIRIIGIHNDEPIDTQVLHITDGVDIVVALPNRARAIYLKLGLNVNKLQLFIVDDASEMVKQGMQLPINELAASTQKCQHLVFTDVMHERIEKMIGAFMKLPTYIEVDDLGDEQVDTHTQVVYHLPNFRTKLNLLNLLLADKEVFDKAVVFVNTRLTAQTLAKDLFNGKADDIFVLKPLFFDEAGFDYFEDFKLVEEARVLIVANELGLDTDLSNIPFVFHFELPENNEQYLKHIVKHDTEQDNVFLTFVTDLELPQLKKIEQSTGKKIEFAELPEELLIEEVVKKPSKKKKQDEEESAIEEFKNAAFQPKKESNAKTTNIGAGKKAKLNKIKKHS
jgi:ATP-dependent RNA helicase RhlE